MYFLLTKSIRTPPPPNSTPPNLMQNNLGVRSIISWKSRVVGCSRAPARSNYLRKAPGSIWRVPATRIWPLHRSI